MIAEVLVLAPVVGMAVFQVYLFPIAAAVLEEVAHKVVADYPTEEDVVVVVAAAVAYIAEGAHGVLPLLSLVVLAAAAAAACTAEGVHDVLPLLSWAVFAAVACTPGEVHDVLPLPSWVLFLAVAFVAEKFPAVVETPADADSTAVEEAVSPIPVSLVRLPVFSAASPFPPPSFFVAAFAHQVFPTAVRSAYAYPAQARSIVVSLVDACPMLPADAAVEACPMLPADYILDPGPGDNTDRTAGTVAVAVAAFPVPQ